MPQMFLLASLKGRPMRDLPQAPKLIQGRIPGKITVVESFYHHREGMQPKGTEARYTRWLKSDAPMVVDELIGSDRVGGMWVQIQFGRIREVGMVYIENLEGTDYNKVPSEEERQATERRALEVFFLASTEDLPDGPAPIYVPAGETARFVTSPGISIWVRCKDPAQSCAVRVTVVPR